MPIILLHPTSAPPPMVEAVERACAEGDSSVFVSGTMSTSRRGAGESSGWGSLFGIGQIGAACALGYLDFRFADENWRASRPQLATWYEDVRQRPSVVSTQPT